MRSTAVVLLGLAGCGSRIEHRNLQLLVENGDPFAPSELSVDVVDDDLLVVHRSVVPGCAVEPILQARLHKQGRRIHITYTWRREKVRHAIIDPAKLTTKPIVNGQWPE